MEELEDQPSLGGERQGDGDGDGELEAVAGGEVADPGDRADHPCPRPADEGQHTQAAEQRVAHQGPRPDRRRVDLAEAVAVGGPPPGEGDGDRQREHGEEEQGARRPRTDGGIDQEAARDRELRHGKEDGERRHRRRGRTEGGERGPGPVAVAQLRQPGDGEDRGEDQAHGDEEARRHGVVSAQGWPVGGVWRSLPAHPGRGDYPHELTRLGLP